jgi:hypothetical protein
MEIRVLTIFQDFRHERTYLWNTKRSLSYLLRKYERVGLFKTLVLFIVDNYGLVGLGGALIFSGSFITQLTAKI